MADASPEPKYGEFLVQFTLKGERQEVGFFRYEKAVEVARALDSYTMDATGVRVVRVIIDWEGDD